MTGDDVPTDPSVLNTTVLSNFAYVDQVEILGRLSGVCTVPMVREELQDGVDSHPYLRSALDSLDDAIPVAALSDAVQSRKTELGDRLNPGEAQALAMADIHDGRLLTDDGDARSIAREEGVTVVGSVGVLLAAIDDGRIEEATADRWLSTWIDEMGYYVPHRDIKDYR